MAEMDQLGIADNTIVIVMGDNGHFTKYAPQSGYTPMIFRGGKGDTSEGGVRVDAFVRWPGVIEANSVVGDMIHVSDLFTTLARLGGATDKIPTDRIIDGLDQNLAFVEWRDLWPPRLCFPLQHQQVGSGDQGTVQTRHPGVAASKTPFLPISTICSAIRRKNTRCQRKSVPGAVRKFVNMLQRHMARKEKYPSEGPAVGLPYEGIENLRPETIALRDEFLFMRQLPER